MKDGKSVMVEVREREGEGIPLFAFWLFKNFNKGIWELELVVGSDPSFLEKIATNRIVFVV